MFTIEQIFAAHDKVKSGADFPIYIKEIKDLGVIGFETRVIDSQTHYIGKDGYKIASQPQYENLFINDVTDKEKFLSYLKMHQQAATDYPTFCKHCATTGIEKWYADLGAMTCTYFDKHNNEILVEMIPFV